MIDVVYTWVDGNDPELKRRRLAAMGGNADCEADDVGGATRYAALGELQWSVATVNRFMPWVRRIYIVTDGQKPQIESKIDVRIVDHRKIFSGYEHLLPVFNSLSIETMLWRIPGLSRHYLYFNDDMFVMAPMKATDWFDGDRLVVHGHLMSARLTALTEHFRFYKGKHAIGFKTAMLAGARALNSPYYVYYYHSALPQDRKLLEKFFAARPELMERNATPKFREATQFSTHALCLMLARRAGLLALHHNDINLFLKPVASRPDYLTTRLAHADRNPGLRLGCISSLDRASEAQRKEFEQWITRRIES